MNTKTLREKMEAMIPVMKAFEEGKKVQCLSHIEGVGWYDINEPSWLKSYEYRVKPEPLVIYGNVYLEDHGSEFAYDIHTEKSETIYRAGQDAIRKGVKFIEVEE